MEEYLKIYLQEIIGDDFTVKKFLKELQSTRITTLKLPDKRIVKLDICSNAKECVDYVQHLKKPEISKPGVSAYFLASKCCINCTHYYSLQHVAGPFIPLKI